MTHPPVTVAPPGSESAVVSCITMAFTADPVLRWMYPDPQQYLTHMPPFVRVFAGKAFALGTAYTISGDTGAALWLPPGAEPDEAALVENLQATVHEREQGDLFGMLEQMGRFHPEEPHWYAPLLGVDPRYQRAGLGSALMAHAAAVFDASGAPAYLDSTNPSNIPFYERCGFELQGTIQAGGSPPMYAMLRRPR